MFGEPIYSYTRRDAIEDGVLVDVSELAAPVGFTVPVALTAAVYADCCRWAGVDPEAVIEGQDTTAGVRDLLHALRRAINGYDGDRLVLDAALCAAFPARCRMRPTIAMITGGDNGEPVITVMQENED